MRSERLGNGRAGRRGSRRPLPPIAKPCRQEPARVCRFCGHKLAFFGKDSQPRHLDDALEAVDVALEEFCKAKADFYIEKAECLRETISRRKANYSITAFLRLPS